MKRILPVVSVAILLAACNDTRSANNSEKEARAAEARARQASIDEAARVEDSIRAANYQHAIDSMQYVLDTTGLAAWQAARARQRLDDQYGGAAGLPSGSGAAAAQRNPYYGSPARDRSSEAAPSGSRTRKGTAANRTNDARNGTASGTGGNEKTGKDTAATDEAAANPESATAKKSERRGVRSSVKGAVIGAAGGAAAGAILNKKNRGKGAVVGGVIGGAAGYGLGKRKEKRDTADHQ